MLSNELIAYTDGAYSNSRLRGGYAFVIEKDGVFVSKYLRGENNTTNQRTEILAVISLFRYLLKLKYIPKTLIITDSMYVVGTATKNWKMNANKDLWQLFFYYYNQLKEYITFKHVRGHQGNEGNELADIYAVIASEGKSYG